MFEGKTLVPILCMHRSGSSLATNVLYELGMSLGPFSMLALRGESHGYFEAHEVLGVKSGAAGPCVRVCRRYARVARDAAAICGKRRPLARGRRRAAAVVRSRPGADRALSSSGAVSGFKDPRVPLVWPSWAEVLRRMPGLRVVPVVLLRSPHEIAMSIFMRSNGRFDYRDALDVTAVHCMRMAGIMADWPGPVARVRFLPEYFCGDLRAACRLLGLAWNDEVYSRVFNVGCKHHEAAAGAHPAQAIFEQLASLPAQEFTGQNAARIAADANFASASCATSGSKRSSGIRMPRWRSPRPGPHWLRHWLLGRLPGRNVRRGAELSATAPPKRPGWPITSTPSGRALLAAA